MSRYEELKLAVCEILNDRQKDLQKLALFHGFTFDHKRTTSILKFRFAPFEIAKKAEYGENMILAATKQCNFFITDIHVEEGALMTKRNYNMSIILVTDIHKQIPEFILEKTGALDMIKEIGGLHDIDFDQYPNFSDEYFLGGIKEDEEDIRAFFNPELLRFFELNKGYTVDK